MTVIIINMSTILNPNMLNINKNKICICCDRHYKILCILAKQLLSRAIQYIAEQHDNILNIKQCYQPLYELFNLNMDQYVNDEDTSTIIVFCFHCI